MIKIINNQLVIALTMFALGSWYNSNNTEKIAIKVEYAKLISAANAVTDHADYIISLCNAKIYRSKENLLGANNYFRHSLTELVDQARIMNASELLSDQTYEHVKEFSKDFDIFSEVSSLCSEKMSEVDIHKEKENIDDALSHALTEHLNEHDLYYALKKYISNLKNFFGKRLK